MKNQIKMVRIKSDNWDEWMSEKAYREATLQMSSGDFGSHTAKHITLSEKAFKKLLHRGYVDFQRGQYWMRSVQGWEVL